MKILSKMSSPRRTRTPKKAEPKSSSATVTRVRNVTSPLRTINETDNISSDFLKEIYFPNNDFVKGVITRKKVTKINGIRHYFYYTQENEENMIAKAKTFSAKTIPITAGNEIHLSSPSFIAELNMLYENSHFSLITRESNPDSVMDIDFHLPRQASDGDKKMKVFFLFEPNYPSPLVNTSINDEPAFGDVQRQISIKNCILKNQDNEQQLIIIRKTRKDTIEITSKLNILPVCIFALGIASFLGKKPHSSF